MTMTVLPPPPLAASGGSGPPAAPGALGVAIEPAQILAYLDAVGRWHDALYATLENLDARAQRAQGFAALTTDMTLAYAVWQSIHGRIEQLRVVWDSGRVGRKEREEIAGLIWGRLDPKAGAGLPVSLVEACVLADALVTQLRTRIDADKLAGSGDSARLAPLREQLARCRTLAREMNKMLDRVDALTQRLDATENTITSGVSAKAPLDQLEIDASALERDLIVGASLQQRIDRDRAELPRRLAALTAFEEETRAIAARCVEKIAAAPRLAVPSVAALGPVPGPTGDVAVSRDALDAYVARVALVDKALHQARGAFERPLAERDDLRGLLESYRAMAGARGRGEDPAATDLFTRAKAILWSAPCDLAEARRLVEAYQQLARTPSAEDLATPRVENRNLMSQGSGGPRPTDAVPTDAVPTEHADEEA